MGFQNLSIKLFELVSIYTNMCNVTPQKNFLHRNGQEKNPKMIYWPDNTPPTCQSRCN